MSDDETNEGVVESLFVRQDFYLEPPAKNAPAEEWVEWLKQDTAKARAAKAQHTKSLKHTAMPNSMQPRVVSKVGGVYRQSAMVGFVGSAEQDNLRVEAAIDADQTKSIVTSEYNHGGRGSKGSKRMTGAARRQARKAAQKAKLRLVKH